MARHFSAGGSGEGSQTFQGLETRACIRVQIPEQAVVTAASLLLISHCVVCKLNASFQCSLKCPHHVPLSVLARFTHGPCGAGTEGQAGLWWWLAPFLLWQGQHWLPLTRGSQCRVPALQPHCPQRTGRSPAAPFLHGLPAACNWLVRG